MPRSDKVQFPGSAGQRLVARLEHPGYQPRAFAVFAHCFTCSKDLRSAVAISRALAQRGIAVLRFDFTGIGESGGTLAESSFAINVQDVEAAAAWLRAEHQAPQLLVGHSLGGAACVVAAPRIPEIRAVATIAAPFDPAHTRLKLEHHVPELAERGEAEVQLGGKRFNVRRSFWDDTGPEQMRQALSEMDAALLVLHSPEDRTLEFEIGRQLYEAASEPRSFVSLAGADHLLSDPDDAAWVAELLAAWSGRYLERAGTHRAETSEALRVEEVGPPYEQVASVRGHRLVIDEPDDVGGDDLGPTPYELLLAGLGSCTAITLRMYANRKGWPLERVAVELKHSKVHARDCEDCETRSGRIDVLERKLELEGDLDGEQRQRLLEIANRCPVHRTLEGEIKVRTSLDPAG